MARSSDLAARVRVHGVAQFGWRRLVASIAAALLTLAAAGRASADEDLSLRQYLRQTWQTAEGLPQNSVRAIAQTREGYLWFGTAEGLVRFDGIRLTVLNKISTPSFPTNNIDSLAVAADGTLWISFRRHGLGRLQDGRLEVWTTAQGLSSNDLSLLTAAADGSIWAASAGQGLNRIRDGQVTVYRKAQGLPDDTCLALSLSRSGRDLLVATPAGAARVSDIGVTRLGAYESSTIPEQSTVTSLLEGDAGDVWIGTTKGLLRVQSDHQQLFTTADGLPANDVSMVVRGHEAGTIWIGLRSGGVARFRNHHFESFTGADGLPDDDVRDVYEDHEGNIWVGTNAGGVSRLHSTPFHTVSKRDGLPADVTRAVFQSADGAMWIGTPAQGLARIHGGVLTKWTVHDGLAGDGVSMIGQSSDGAMWIGSRDGLVRMAGDAFTRYTTANGLPNANVRAMFEERDGAIWIGTFSGLCRIDGPRCVAVDGLNFNARGFYQAPDGALWIASNHGLWRYDHDHGPTKHWGEHDGLSNDFLTSLSADADGTLWLSTNGAGLNRFKDGHITTYRLAQGLYDDNIFRVLADAHGWLWLTSNRGLFRVARAELDAIAAGHDGKIHSQVYTEIDGLPSPEFNGGSFPAGVVAHDGRLWLPSAKGIVIVDPTRVEPPHAAPSVFIERAVMDGRPLDSTTPSSVGPGEGNLEFQYTAFQFVAPTRLRFRYKLDGFDADWVDAGARRTAYYTRVPPGDYVFRVQASNDTGTWGAEHVTAAITLKPRVYQTAWFRGLGALALVLLIAGGVQWRIAQHRAQERRLVEMVDARTRELQDEIEERTRAERALVDAREAALEASRLKSEFLANMSHEIRTPMNGIIGMTDLALDHELEPRVREYLQIVGSSAHALLHVINDILDFAKIEAGRLELVTADFDVREIVKDLVALLGPQAKNKGLALRGDIAPGVPARIIGDPLRLRQVLTNLVGNALKFTDTGEIRIEVSCVDLPETLRFAVVDTGIGIAESDRNRIFEAFTQADGSATRRFGGTGLGLAISSHLVQLMGGQLDLHSTIGRGSTFFFTLTFTRAELPKPVLALPAHTSATRSLNVLVAEDGATNQLLVRLLLEKAGHKVTIVENGAAAVEAVATSQFDICLMDVQMPEMNGFDATRHIRTNENGARRRLPIIALTAHAMQGDRERCLEAGMDGYITKPIRPDVLFASLAEFTPSRDAA